MKKLQVGCVVVLMGAVAGLLAGCDGSSDSNAADRATGEYLSNPAGTYHLVSFFDSNDPKTVWEQGFARVDGSYNIWYTLRRVRRHSETGDTEDQAFNVRTVDPGYMFDGDTLSFTLADSVGGYRSFIWERDPYPLPVE